MRVTRADSSRVVLDSPRLLGDTLAGSVDDHPFQMARSDVQGIETLHFSGGKTLGLLVGMAALVVVAIGAAFAIGCPNGACGN